jgi:hypothetical protein
MRFVRRNSARLELVFSFMFGLLKRDVAELLEGFVEVLGACSVVQSVLFSIILEVSLLYTPFPLFNSHIWSVLCVLISSLQLVYP